MPSPKPAAPPRAKTARLEARVTPEQKALLQRAADLSGPSLTDFVVASAQEAARRAIEAHAVVRLSAEDSRRFVELLLNPPEPRGPARGGRGVQGNGGGRGPVVRASLCPRQAFRYDGGMSTTALKKTLAARDLPAEWREEGRFAPDERVTVWIEPEDAELAGAASLRAVMDVVGRRMGERGLTEAKLEDILNEA